MKGRVGEVDVRMRGNDVQMCKYADVQVKGKYV